MWELEEGRIVCGDAYGGWVQRFAWAQCCCIVDNGIIEDANTRDWKRSSAIESFNDISVLRWIVLLRRTHDQSARMPKDVADDAKSSRLSSINKQLRRSVIAGFTGVIIRGRILSIREVKRNASEDT